MEVMTEEFIQTELGSIPADWKLCRFEDVMDGFSSGQTPYREIKRYYTGNIPWITSGELNYNVVTDTIEKITDEAVRKTSLKIIPKGTFLMAITGLEAAGTRGSCAITGVDATTNQSCMALYPKPGLLITDYLFHFYVRYGDFLAFKYCQGTKQQSYTGAIAKTLPIILPPTIEEQTAIAKALSDADALITSLEKLIAKKKAIKQGVMQKLLQPKEGWEVKKLGEECEMITKGTTPTSIGKDFQSQGINFIKIESLEKDGKIVNDKVAFIDVRTHALLKRSQLKSGDILFSIAGALGRVATVSSEILPANTNQALAIIRLKKDSLLIKDFVFHILSAAKIQNYILSISVQGAQANLSLQNIFDLPIEFPSIDEQSRIALMLNDINAEILTLERRLSKQTQLKQGMMQNLLTGKIRLIKNHGKL